MSILNTHHFLFLKELQYLLIDSVLDNICETPTRISAMIPGVVILTIHFSSKLIFAISNVYWTCVLKACDFFHK